MSSDLCEYHRGLLTVNMNMNGEPSRWKRRDDIHPDMQYPRHYGLTVVLLNLRFSK
jgi:hypothetical protein